MKIGMVLLLLLVNTGNMKAQELYVFTEPASNIPAHALSARITGHFVGRDRIYGRFSQRYMPELMAGISKNLMVHLYGTWADMHVSRLKFESYGVYAKYRFFSNDGLHRHFRMAAFADASKTNSPFHYDETTLMGDKSGLSLGLIATQLWHKWAVSATLSTTQVLDKSRGKSTIYIPPRNYQAMDYSLSTGYLLFPREYKGYDQVNLNLYLELLGQRSLDRRLHFTDLAPALQFIFGSNTRLNFGYRFQLEGTMQRMATQSYLVSVERIFLNALKK